MVDGMFRYVVCRKSLILFTRYYSSSNKFFTIGDTQIKVRKPLFPHLVPIGFAVDEPSTSTLSLLKWMVQKDSLRQDIFLIGAPGPRRLDLVLKYLELCGREYEYLPITRDTTEGDIKQRRELRSGTAYYTDLCAVRAALNGRVLIIDGVEKAERNVLPILNSLLESREMQLDDGRFLIPAERYNWLLKELGEGIMCEKKLERVSNDFMIIALGLPVPPFRGHSLDPPLRSRFQCRSIFSRDFATVMRDCSEVAPNVLSNGLTNLISSIFALNFTELRSFSLPQFPLDNISRLAAIWNNIPELSPGTIFELGYPYKSLVTSGPQELAFEHYLLKFYIDAGRKRKKIPLRIESIDSKDGVAEIRCGSSIHRIKVPVGASDEVASRSIFTAYVNNDEQDRFMAKMILSHASGDFCILGPKGCGKTTIVEEFATRLGYPCGTMTLYQDMNSRELLQERRMLSNGDTIWEDSVLVDCAKEGKICVIDGIERVHWSTLEILSPLVHHRQIDLFDGTRLVESGRFKRISVKTGLSKDQLKLKGLFEIHPSFRIIAIGDSNNESRWLNDQILSLFVFHTMESLNIDSQCHIVNSIVPYSSVEETRKLVAFVNSLMHSTDAGLRSTAQSISLRRIIHLIQRHTAHKDEDISEGIKRAAMAKFLPSVTKDAFMGALGKTEFRIGSKLSKTPKCNVDLKRSSVGGGRDIDRTMVPEVLFYDNEQHSAIIVDMVRDMELGSHLLLIGNQGVGKNKVTDRLLHLINRPRRYLQLHRDITVQSLTVNSSVIDGCLIHEDSALVKAARDGDVLVIDEADKAPLHVVAVLKSLLDIGVLRLADGRVIEPKNISKGHRSIPLHPDFRIIMLANRPGFPFLGNDLFSILGDLFAVHVVDNPSYAAEYSMLKNYAPDVPDEIIRKLCLAFNELRTLADQSVLTYPYSTRELVNIAKHLQMFKNSELNDAIRNVFDFDRFAPDTMETVSKILRKNGIPFGKDSSR